MNKAGDSKKNRYLKTELKHYMERLEYLQTHDTLTHCVNLAALKNTIQNNIEYRSSDDFSVVTIDINNFCFINETFGHLVGDNILKTIADRIIHFLDTAMYCARTIGDEYIILLNVSKSEVSYRVKKLLSIINQPCEVDGQHINLTVSAGISSYGIDAYDTETLLEHASSALDHAKRLGIDNYVYCTHKIAIQTRERRILNRDLVSAFEKNEFKLVYQPQVNIETGRIIGAEALLRWKHPLLGYIKPAYFIPLLENSGYILKVGDWVLHQACAQMEKWHAIDDALIISVNVSAKQLAAHSTGNKSHIMKSVRYILSKTRLQPESLVLELTESFVVHHNPIIQHNLQKLHNLKVKIACDDFGIGYSSFARLTKLPFNIIKLDKSLIDGTLRSDSLEPVLIHFMLDIAKKNGHRGCCRRGGEYRGASDLKRYGMPHCTRIYI
jgi:diguanylate cyclase (GGDEF)-like protein